jgi:GT2 family glycosyltransferase
LIVTWNGQKYLESCLRSVAVQTYRDFEVLLVDNGSNDDGWKIASSLLIGIPHRIRQLERNAGFAAANNIGAHMARGRWLALLNQDAYPAGDWLAQLMEAVEQFPGFACYASAQLSAVDRTRIDGAGDAYFHSGLAWRKLHGAPVEFLPHHPYEVFSACAAAALYDRAAFLRAGGFEEEYFAYQEDVDLGFRLRLAGERCLFVPGAVAYHECASSRPESADQRIYLGHRNLELTYLTDMPTPLLIATLPCHLLYLAGALLLFLAGGKGVVYLRAKQDAWKMAPWIRDRRRRIQRTRVIRSRAILRQMNFGVVDFFQRMYFKAHEGK